ncbi:MAG: HPr family phosphocarrier protein, partial [Verrucomicrobiota bacterium]|nr:HPr family phosphocarrier protein [Verrucomicrobiota bacterium]
VNSDRTSQDVFLPNPPELMGARFGEHDAILERERAGMLPFLAKDHRPKGAQPRDLPVDVQHLGFEERDDILRGHRRRVGQIVACLLHRSIYVAPLMRREVEIVNELGLHARPAAEFVRCVQKFESEITIHKGDQLFYGGSILEVLSANLDCGAKVELQAVGSDAREALDQLARLLLEFREQEERGVGEGARRES